MPLALKMDDQHTKKRIKKDELKQVMLDGRVCAYCDQPFLGKGFTFHHANITVCSVDCEESYLEYIRSLIGLNS